MRYITVEDLSFHYDNEPVLEHIHYHLAIQLLMGRSCDWPICRNRLRLLMQVFQVQSTNLLNLGVILDRAGFVD